MPTKKPAAKAAPKKTPATKAGAKKRANFQFEAPSAGEVFVAGTFNEWDPTARPLKRDKAGVFRTWMSLPAGTYEYRFVVDGEWCDDPKADQHVPNPHGGSNSVLVL